MCKFMQTLMLINCFMAVKYQKTLNKHLDYGLKIDQV